MAGRAVAALTLLAARLWWRWLARRVRGEQKPTDGRLGNADSNGGRPPVYADAALSERTGSLMRVGDSSWRYALTNLRAGACR